MGIPLAPEDVTYRCNLVTLSDADNIENAVMIDYSADDISNEEAHELIAAIAPLYAAAGCELHAGFRYRHCLVLRAAASGAELTPPHDITGKPVAGHLPEGENRALLLSLMERSREILRKHPVNKAHRSRAPSGEQRLVLGRGGAARRSRRSGRNSALRAAGSSPRSISCRASACARGWR